MQPYVPRSFETTVRMEPKTPGVLLTGSQKLAEMVPGMYSPPSPVI